MVHKVSVVMPRVTVNAEKTLRELDVTCARKDFTISQSVKVPFYFDLVLLMV